MVQPEALSVSAYLATPVDLIIISIAGVVTQAILRYCCYFCLRSIIHELFLNDLTGGDQLFELLVVN